MSCHFGRIRRALDFVLSLWQFFCGVSVSPSEHLLSALLRDQGAGQIMVQVPSLARTRLLLSSSPRNLGTQTEEHDRVPVLWSANLVLPRPLRVWVAPGFLATARWQDDASAAMPCVPPIHKFRKRVTSDISRVQCSSILRCNSILGKQDHFWDVEALVQLPVFHADLYLSNTCP